MNLGVFEKIKKLAIVAMVSDDELMDRLVLKGGNAIDLVYHISHRSSFDIDFSMSSEFTPGELGGLRDKAEKVLQETFRPEGYRVFDVTFEEKPPKLDEAHRKFWGGYSIGFKLILESTYNQNSSNIEYLRRNATVVGPSDKRVFEIEISKFEYCNGKTAKEIEGYKVYVYTPEMIVLEKARAICQQIPEYRDIVKMRPATARARDFFDIYTLMEYFNINLNESGTKDVLTTIFGAKKVPLNFLRKIKDYKEFHRPDFVSVTATVKAGLSLREFDFYFDYVVMKFEALEF